MESQRSLSLLCLILGTLFILAAWMLGSSSSRLIFWTLLGLGMTFGMVWGGLRFKSWKKTLTSHPGRRGLTHTLRMILIFLTLLAIYLCFYFELVSMRKDFSRERLYSLSKQSREIIESLQKPVRILVFDDPGPANLIWEMLRLYARRSDLIEVEAVDAHKDPLLAAKYGVKDKGTCVFTSPDREPLSIGRSELVRQTSDEAGRRQIEFRYEEKFTAALQTLTTSDHGLCYFVTGHGERSIDDTGPNGLSKAREALALEQLESQSINLAVKNTPSIDAVLVVPGPRKPLSPGEKESLHRHVRQGGRVIILVDPLTDSQGIDIKIDSLLSRWGVILHNDLVVDKANHFRIQGKTDAVFFPVLVYVDHDIIRPLENRRIRVAFFGARSLSRSSTPPSGILYETLLMTSGTGYGETSFTDSDRVLRYDRKEDLAAPVTVGATLQIRGEGGEREGRVVIYGDSGFLANRVLDNGGHRDLWINTLRWLFDQKEKITLRPRVDQVGEILLSAQQEQTALIYFLLVQPGLLIAGGLFFVYRRQRK